jgi:hypothetical protein
MSIKIDFKSSARIRKTLSVWYDAHENFLVLLELSTLFQGMSEI